MYISSISNYGIINNLRKSEVAIAKSNQRLSSGQKLASDSPVDFGIASRLDSNIRTSDANQRNIQDSLSFIETANAGLDEASDMVMKLKELSVRYKNDTLSKVDKAVILDSAKEIGKAISNVFKDLKFNGKPVFDHGSINLTVGKDKIEFNINDLINQAEQTMDTFANKTVDTVSNLVRNVTGSASWSSSLIEGLSSKSQIKSKALYAYGATLGVSDVVSNEKASSSSASTSTAIVKSQITKSMITTPTTITTSSKKNVNKGEGYYDLPDAVLSLPDQEGYTGYKKVLDSKGNVAYEGALTDGIPDGYGKYYENGKLVYEGDFKNGQYDGYGTIYDKNNGKVVYRGDIKDGEANGWGTYYGNNGKVLYEGGFKEGYRDGWGTTYDTNGKWLESKMYSDYDNRPIDGSNPPQTGDGSTDPSNGGGNVDYPPPSSTDPPSGGTGDGGSTGGTGNNGEATNPPGDGSEDGGNGGVTNPPTNGSDDSGAGGTTNPPANESGGPGNGEVTNPPTNGSDGKGDTGGKGDGETKPPTNGGDATVPSIPSTPNHPIDLGDLGSLDPDDLLNGDLLDQVKEGIDQAKEKLGTSQWLLERRLRFEAEQNDIMARMRDRLQSTDTARELMEKAKQEMLLQVNSVLFAQNIESQRSMIKTLLSSI